jgi:cation:H+ antiporter
MDYLITIAGLVLLLAGGEGLVRGAVGIARRARISPMIVGLTIIGFGTSAPELVVSVDAVLSGIPGLAVGNVIGSNIANIMLVVGTAAIIAPLAVHRDVLVRDSIVLVGATLLFVAIALGGAALREHGFVMLITLVLYLGYSLWVDRRRTTGAAKLHSEEAEEIETGLPERLDILIGATLIGLAALVGGSRLAVLGATAIARDYGVSEELIGLTLVAIGTSLPELATAVIAARRGHDDVCIGNVIGSSIFNLLAITGAAAIAGPLPFSAAIVSFDIWALLGVTLILTVVMLTGRKITRLEGVVLVSLYALYIGIHLYGFGGTA